MSQPEQLIRPLSLLPAEEIPRCGVEWLWPGRLALGKLALLEGDPGLGKSFVGLDLCARLSAGQPWPDGSPTGGPAASVYLNAEDGAADTLGPRLCALGADMTRVYLLDRAADDLTEVLTLSAQMRTVDELLGRIRPRLLVIDPITPFLGPQVNMGSDSSVRHALAPLADLARRIGCAVLLVRHLTKSGRGKAIYRGLGSIGLVGACRSAWLVAERTAAPGQRVLAQVKNNLASPQPTLAFELRPDESGAALHWLGEAVETADDLLGRPHKRGVPPEKRRCARMCLEELLADGPLSSREVWERIKDKGFSVRTIERAKQEGRIRSERVFQGGGMVSYWLLDGQELPPEKSGLNPIQCEAERRFREAFPTPTPLDRM